MASYKQIILKAWSLREKYIDFTTTDVYRLVNSYGDGLPEVTIDVYGKNFLVQYFKPYEKHERDEIYAVLKEFFKPETITEKIRLKDADVKTVVIAGLEAPRDFIVLENGIKFTVSFTEGGGTGLFPDQRGNRKKIQALAKSMEMLNCFSYTASFSVYASIGGACRTTNVDLSKKAIEWSKKNFLVNQLDIQDHEFITGDVWDWTKRFEKKGRMFDLIIMDPPSFSTSKTRVFSVERDFPELIGCGLNILRDNGILVFSTNIAKMSFSRLFQVMPKIKHVSTKTYKIIDVASQGLDFPVDGIYSREPYLKFIMLTC
ncbi:MAG: class I SAM-dependent rRNA methyltransferase [Candidatus Loosdrechtia sp.]|uniref:class I SAM-dependent rRNA methyltransferase n=1 Tax=Candidatus Loosdrechtia sp. TaxID=3101272 RepID=UPI003A738F6F|nr:MAG: class I SAM-dependent rRNA methyltransferase [Candidatus Jettenia sp. AMX2]